VIDTGIGISTDFLPYVFDRFRQAVARRQGQGRTWTRLAIVLHLVELHGGSIYVDSDGAGQGATLQ